MLELGKKSRYFHQRAGKIVAGSGIDMLMTLGPLSKLTSKSARRYGMKRPTVIHFDSRDNMGHALKHLLRKDDVVLVKGSRGMRMEQFIEKLKTDSH